MKCLLCGEELTEGWGFCGCAPYEDEIYDANERELYEEQLRDELEQEMKPLIEQALNDLERLYS